MSPANSDRELGLWDKLSFSWVNGPVKNARKGTVEPEDLFLPQDAFTDACHDEFARAWRERLSRDNVGSRPLVKTLLSLYGRLFFTGGLAKLGWSVCVIGSAFYFVRSLLLYVDEDEDDHPYTEAWTGWPLATGFFIAATVWGLCAQRMGYVCMRAGLKVRAALTAAITRKAVALSKVSAENASDIVSFMANDIGKVYDGMQEFHYLWCAPIEAFSILALLASLVGGWALPGLAIISFVLFIQYFFGWQIAKNKFLNADNVNERGSILQEVLPAMKLVKYYGWEDFIEGKIRAIRKLESRLMTQNIFYKTFNICLVFTVPPLCATVIFVSYEFQDSRLDSTIAFTTLTLFNIMRFPLVVLPKALRAASEASTCIKRIENFLLNSETQEDGVDGSDESSSVGNGLSLGKSMGKSLPDANMLTIATDKAGRGIDMNDAVFQYDGHDGHGFKLTVPEFNVKPGEVVAVVGRVGAGKTAVLEAILGNMPLKVGDARVGGRIAYVPQTAWIQNMAIRDNILFGLPYDDNRYREVVHSCALEQDFAMLPQGDQSAGGLRGMNLSGGQRQRVNVARAVYFNADTVLLDNALSAVDHHTAEHMFNNCVKGTLASKAVVLVTHQLQFIRRCDKVAIIDHGKFQYFGPFNANAQTIMSRYLPVPAEETAAAEVEEEKKAVVAKPKAMEQKIEAKPVTALPMKEASWRLLNAGPAWKCILGMSLGLVSQSSRQMSDFWIRSWADDGFALYESEDEHGEHASTVYASGYASLCFAFWFIQILRTGTFFFWGKHASDRIMKRGLHRTLNAPMGLFLAKPVGELLATFSSDQDRLDEPLPEAMHLAFVYGFIILSTTVTIGINIREFWAFLFVLLGVTGLMLHLYLPCATRIKALRATATGQLVGLTAEVLEGLKVIQAFDHKEHFVREFTRRSDRTNRTIFTADSLNLWVSFYCDFYGAIMLLAICFFAVAFRERGSAVVGLAFSNTIQLLVFYTWTLRLITESISLLGSAEQLTWLAYKAPIDGQDDVNNAGQPLETAIKWKDLKKLKEERLAEEKKIVKKSQNKALSNWPADGRIVFHNVRMRYRPTAGFALNGVNLTISHGEHVGVVGRTGSGKSSLLMALFRMFDLAEGSISVGGVDVTLLPLIKARRGLSIIPQEPVMFSGTLRENLDPYNEHSDFELYNLLVEVGLREQAEAAGGLDGHVDGSGSDQWSVGQCQLVCLIRAALNKVPLVCMDEATAALDPHTEAIVLEVARKLFGERTVITIAHRLEAVIESDTVVVMDTGKVAETGMPDKLLADRTSEFSKLVDKSGPTEAAALREMAHKHFAEKRKAYEEYHPRNSTSVYAQMG